MILYWSQLLLGGECSSSSLFKKFLLFLYTLVLRFSSVELIFALVLNCKELSHSSPLLWAELRIRFEPGLEKAWRFEFSLQRGLWWCPALVAVSGVCFMLLRPRKNMTSLTLGTLVQKHSTICSQYRGSPHNQASSLLVEWPEGFPSAFALVLKRVLFH